MIILEFNLIFLIIFQQIAFKNLVKKNERDARMRLESATEEARIQLPFIIVNTSKDTVIDCQMAEDKYAHKFNDY